MEFDKTLFEKELTTIYGKTTKLSDLGGKKAIVIHFWATWCGPCHGFNSYLSALYGKPGIQESVRMASFSLDGMSRDRHPEWEDDVFEEKLEDVEPIVLTKLRTRIESDKILWDDHFCSFRNWLDPTAMAFKVMSIPVVFLFDADLNIIPLENKIRLSSALTELLKLK